jgi:hypothetical protein
MDMKKKLVLAVPYAHPYAFARSSGSSFLAGSPYFKV